MVYIIKDAGSSLDKLINRISEENEVQIFDYYDALDNLNDFREEDAVIILEYKAEGDRSTEFVDVANALLNYRVRPILLITEFESLDADSMKNAAFELENIWNGNENDSMGYQFVYYDEVNDVSFRSPEGPTEEGATEVLDAINRENEWPYMGD
jgi:hypothetical protein